VKWYHWYKSRILFNFTKFELTKTIKFLNETTNNPLLVTSVAFSPVITAQAPQNDRNQQNGW
jgi:hypothetical protein